MNVALTGWIHPRFRQIESFAYGSGNERLSATVHRHLESCGKCQNQVRALRALRADAREADIPPMSPDLRKQALAFAVDGARIIPALPAELPHRSGRRWPAYAAAAAVVAAFALLPSRGLNAGASAGELTLLQTSAAPAPVINVRYVAGGLLDGSDRVTLRVNTYIGREFVPESHEFTLMRGSEQAFAGSVTLPTGATYAQYELVSADGQHVDDNDARGWESSMADSTGRPLLDGLYVQQFITSRTNWETALAAARAMWQHYPNEPTALRFAMSNEMQLAGSARTDSALGVWRPRISALNAKLAHAALQPDQMWELAMVGGQANDTMMVNFWRARLINEFPRHPSTIQQRVFAVGERRVGKERIVPELDRIFDETGGQSPQLLSDGFSMAVKYGDSAAIARWGDRLLAYGRGYESAVWSAYASYPAFRTRGMEMLRASLASLAAYPSADWQSALRTRVGETQRPVGQWQLIALGSALLDAGKIEAARDTLRRAAALGWDVRAMRALGDADLSAGDTTGAVAAYAWISADPRTSITRADTLRARLGGAGKGAAWDAAVMDGRTLIDGITLRSAIHRKFDATSSFAVERGERTTLAKAIGKAPYAIVAFISRNCGPSLSDLAALTSRTAELGKRGIPVITLVEESPSAKLTADVTRYGFTGKLAYDDRGVVSRAMRQSGTPQYFVVENGDDIRFDARRIEDVIPFVDAIVRKK